MVDEGKSSVTDINLAGKTGWKDLNLDVNNVNGE